MNIKKTFCLFLLNTILLNITYADNVNSLDTDLNITYFKIYYLKNFKHIQHQFKLNKNKIKYLENKLNENNLPELLIFIPLIESNFRAEAVSTSNAVGYFQFMKLTAEEYGLKINEKIDERKDFYKAADAAIAYFKNLHRQFGDWDEAWDFVIASYNAGENRVRSGIKKAIANHKKVILSNLNLPQETIDYVHKIKALQQLKDNKKFFNINFN